MADVKISALPAGSALAGTEEFAAVQSGVTNKITATQIQTFASAGGANKTLSNLTSPTSINQDLVPNGSKKVGSVASPWSEIRGTDGYFDTVSAANSNLDFYSGNDISFNATGAFQMNNNYSLNGNLVSDIVVDTDGAHSIGSDSLALDTVYAAEVAANIFSSKNAVDLKSISMTSGEIKDSTGVKSLQFEARELYDSSNNRIADWGATNLYTNAGSRVMTWGSRATIDSGGEISIDWESKYLKDGPFGIVKVNWSANILKDSADQTAMGWGAGNRVLYDDAGTASLDWSSADRITFSKVAKLFNSASDPASGAAGDIYYNSTLNKIKFYNGTTWETVTST